MKYSLKALDVGVTPLRRTSKFICKRAGCRLLVAVLISGAILTGCIYPGAEEHTQRLKTGTGQDLLLYSEVVTTGATNIVLLHKYDKYDEHTTGPNYIMWTRLEFPEQREFEAFMKSLQKEVESAGKVSSNTVSQFMKTNDVRWEMPSSITPDWRDDTLTGGLQIVYPHNCWMIAPERRIVWRYAYNGELVAKLN